MLQGTKNWGDKIYIHETVNEISHLGSPHGIKKKIQNLCPTMLHLGLQVRVSIADIAAGYAPT